MAGALVKTLAKGALKKKVKKKGAEMAKNIINKKEKDDSSSIVVREKSTSLVGPLLGGDTDSTDSSANTSKKSRSRSPLDRINSSLKNIMKTLKKRRKLMLNKSRRMRVQANKEKKGKREGLLEKKKKGKKMLGNVKAAAVGWWERLQKFLLMTFLGALVLAIKKNWEAIQEKIGETVTKIKELWENLEPILTPIWEIAKWIAVESFKIIKPLLGMGKDKAEIEKGTDEVSKGLEEIKKKTSWIEGLFKKSKEDTEKLKDEDYSKEFKDLEKMKSEDKENPGDDLKETEQTVADVKDKIEEIKLDLPKFEEGAVPVKETGPAIVHKGEVIIPAHIVKMAGGALKVENIINIMSEEMSNLPGLGGGGGGTNALTESAKVKTFGSAISDLFSGDDGRSRRLKEDTNRGSVIADLSDHLPSVMVEKMQETLTTIKEQTEYEDPTASTIIIRVPTSAPQSGGGGGGGKAIPIPVGPTAKDTLNRYVNAVIQKALY